MINLTNLLPGNRVIDEMNSALNGKLTVIRSIAFGTYIQAGGLTQSGGILYEVWETTLKKVKRRKKEITNCLIIGLGGGSNAKLVQKYWPSTKITGVDIDPAIVELGKRHLGIEDVNIKIADALAFSKNAVAKNKKYDLILVDLYVGDEYPLKFEKGEFIKLTKKLVRKNGLVVFNRLHYDEKRKIARKFREKLEKIFEQVDIIYPEVNIMFVCSN